MADSKIIMKRVKKLRSTKYQALTPNKESVSQAFENGYDEIFFITSACKHMLDHRLNCTMVRNYLISKILIRC